VGFKAVLETKRRWVGANAVWKLIFLQEWILLGNGGVIQQNDGKKRNKERLPPSRREKSFGHVRSTAIVA
jgi:hypothetical protein